jgi:eukaryotic-like serine/threonine-protein kinase
MSRPSTSGRTDGPTPHEMSQPSHPIDQALADLGQSAEGPGAAWEKRAIEARLFGEPEVPERIGRFIVTGYIGHGGMGDVFAAHDEQLDRHVAIKVMSRRTSAASIERFAREGRALAKLSHANIVQVHEVGEHDGALFIAMEHIDGCTLSAWVAEGREQHDWRDALRLCIEAGRGLAVAHAAGLVHRDFKPDNVMVGNDGRVRVLDFGLARAIGEETIDQRTFTSDVDLANTETSGERGAAEPRVTATGARLGTPAYMAPEQHVGDTATAASDQFSFCVTAWEALHGVRPFGGANQAAIFRAIELGRVEPLVRPHRIPAKVRRVLLQGLRVDPRERWPSMDDLLRELESSVTPRRGRGLALMTGLGALVVAGGVWRYGSTPPCAGSDEQLVGVWDEARKEAVRSALIGTGKIYAAHTWERIEQELDDYANAWVTAHTEICEATRVRQVQSEAVMDARMACMNRRRSELAAAVSVLTRADDAVVERAFDIMTSLPRLARCDDLAALQSRVPPPEDPVVAVRVEAVRNEIASARALLKAGDFEGARETSDPLVAEAEALAYAPLVAEALLVRGVVHDRQARFEAAEEDLERAYLLAAEHEHHGTEVEALRMLTWVVGHRRRRIAEGLQWGKSALALARRPSGDDDTEALALSVVGSVLEANRDLEAALAHYQRSLELHEGVFGPDHLATANALDRIAGVVWPLGRVDEAATYFRRALEIAEAQLGPDHPQLMSKLRRLGGFYSYHGDLDESLALQRRALEIGEKALGIDHPEVAGIVMSIASALHGQGELEAALEEHRRALAIFEATLPPEHPEIAVSLANTGIVLMDQGAFAEALVLQRRALAIREKALGAGNPAIAMSTTFVGQCLLELDELEEARVLLARGSELFAATLGETHSSVAFGLRDLAKLSMKEGKRDDALEYATRAVEIMEASQDIVPKASFRFTLAKILWSDARERARARSLAEAARDELAGRGPADARELEKIEAWLREHTAP